MITAQEIKSRPPLPPFTHETALEKVRLAENNWNSCDPGKVALGYTVDSWWRNRAEFIQGRPAIIEFLTRKWRKELDYRLIKELWAFEGSRIAVRFAYECMMTQAIGFALTATRTGNLTQMDSCITATRASTICPSRKLTASFGGILQCLAP